MRKKDKIKNLLLQQKLLPLYYHDRSDVSVSILEALYAAGIRLIEYTNRGKNASPNFKVLRKAVDRNMKDLYLGIGTIKTRKQAKQFMEEGADFIVCPVINEKVAQVTDDASIFWIPGCMSTTEIALAEKCGAEIVKLFPGNLLGPEYVRSIKELFPTLKFMPTGGVMAEEKNLQEWFNAGVCAVGMGSKLISKELVDKNDFDGLKTATIRALELVRSVSMKGL